MRVVVVVAVVDVKRESGNEAMKRISDGLSR